MLLQKGAISEPPLYLVFFSKFWVCWSNNKRAESPAMERDNGLRRKERTRIARAEVIAQERELIPNAVSMFAIPPNCHGDS